MEIPLLLTVALLSIAASRANVKHERDRQLAEWKLRDPAGFEIWMTQQAIREGGRKLRTTRMA
jgi:hypothetical protein